MIGRRDESGYLFLPDSGSMELMGAEPALEAGCLKISTGGTGYILKPERLIFQSFRNADAEWSYFPLETAPLKQIYGYGQGRSSEELTLLTDGSYEEPGVSEYYDPDESPHLIDCRRIERFYKGSFVIFAKASTYNDSTDTTDGRHDKISANEFRDYLADNIKRLAEEESAGAQ